MDKVQNILRKALKLKPADKCIIIEGLLLSLEEPDRTINEMWVLEAEKCLQTFKAGELATIRFEDVFEEEH